MIKVSTAAPPLPVEEMRSMSRMVVENADSAEYQLKFARLVTNFSFSGVGPYTPTITEAVRICLSNDNIPTQLLFEVWHSLALLDEDVKQLVNSGKGSERSFDELKVPLNNAFFLIGLKRFTLAMRVYEALLVDLRRHFLMSDDYDEETFLPFLCTLAEQCNLNEYIYDCPPEEQEAVNALKQDLTFSNDAHTMAKIALIGSYEELSDLECAEEISALAAKSDHAAFKDMVKIQIVEPLKRKSLYSDIPSLSPIKDAVSSAVAKQYEENPYPRWRYIARPNLSEKNKKFSEGKEILVAGCGTGQEPLNVALYYPNAKVLGIDLSIPSIAYGKQKAAELGITNVEFMQADILEIEKLDRTFDLITSGGVLHHMEDPVKGWSKLITRLKPDGIMKIALYSELARRAVVHSRKWIDEQGFAADIDGIKAFRRAVIALEDGNPMKDIMRSTDFYSMSMCRDLVFHVQEHRYTLPQITEILDELNLAFISMKFKSKIAQKKYMAQHPGDKMFKDFDAMHKFEIENPNTFWGMYAFLCNRKDAENPGKKPDWIFAD